MKEKKSKLDQYADFLQGMEAEKKTLPEMVKWLADEGVSVAPSTLSRFLESLRNKAAQERVLAQITSGSAMVNRVEKQFSKTPAPELDTLLKLHRVLIMQMSTEGNADPKMLKLADQMLCTVMEGINGRTKAAHKERELRLAEDKFQIEICERFLEWFKDDKARQIAESSVGNAEKIARLRQEYFKDVDALQQSGKVVLPE